MVVGLIALFIPGMLVFVWFGLSGPVVELEDRTVRGALRPQLPPGPRQLLDRLLRPRPDRDRRRRDRRSASSDLVHDVLGDTFFAGWLAESVSNIVFTPVFAVAAVLLTLDLIAGEGRTGAATVRRSARTDGAGADDRALITASIFSDFWNDHLVDHEPPGASSWSWSASSSPSPSSA